MRRRGVASVTSAFVLSLLMPPAAPAMQASELSPLVLYEKLKSFELGQGTVRTQNLSLKRDRIELVFTGEFYFAKAIGGKVYGAVFLGQGNLRVEPSNTFEKDNVRRFLKSDTVEVTFSSAVLRFTDDTYELLVENPSSEGTLRDRAQKLAKQLEGRLVRETGLNLSARMSVGSPVLP